MANDTKDCIGRLLAVLGAVAVTAGFAGSAICAAESAGESDRAASEDAFELLRFIAGLK